MTATTTWATIRDNIVTLIIGLSPSLMSSVKFREYDYVEDFEEWADSTGAGSFRRFAVMETGENEPPTVWNNELKSEDHGALVKIAYDHSKRYGSKYKRDMETVIDSDRRQITDILELLSSYVSGQKRQTVMSKTITPLNSVTILELDVRLQYYRST